MSLNDLADFLFFIVKLNYSLDSSILEMYKIISN